jgi:uncharacterized protein YndB with AHSA1/START domain
MLPTYIKNVNGAKEMEQTALNTFEMPAAIPDQRRNDVALAFRIEADSSRVLYALSMPEYIEAWLQAPDAEELQFVFNPVTQDAFRIDLYRAEAIQASIHSLCRVVNANQVKYTWKTTSPIGVTETVVDIQLRRSSGGCILGLVHSGFKSTVESAWCCKMWHQSLERLGRLMKKS